MSKDVPNGAALLLGRVIQPDGPRRPAIALEGAFLLQNPLTLGRLRARLARVLDGREVLPLDQLLQVQRQLLRGIAFIDSLLPQQNQDGVPVRLLVHLPMLQVENAHDRTICPTNSITIQNGRPVWGGSCTHCMARICRCPAEAIEYGKKSVGKPRYHLEAL